MKSIDNQTQKARAKPIESETGNVGRKKNDKKGNRRQKEKNKAKLKTKKEKQKKKNESPWECVRESGRVKFEQRKGSLTQKDSIETTVWEERNRTSGKKYKRKTNKNNPFNCSLTPGIYFRFLVQTLFWRDGVRNQRKSLALMQN